jgi:hypothetical protein
MSNDPLAHVRPSVAGSLGGAAASLAQFIGGSSVEFAEHLLKGELVDAMNVLGIFLFATFLLMCLGGLVGYFLQSKTQSRWMLFLSGATATAIGTMALPVLKPLLRKVDIAPISVAYAAEDSSCERDKTFVTGLKDFFGLNDPRFHVVVGSFKRREDAAALVAKINAEDPSFGAFVGIPAPCNPHSAVVVSQPLTLSEAKKVQERARKLNSVDDAFLSPVFFR